MRIVIDMQGAQTESRFRGIGRYTIEFSKAVVRNRGEHEIFLVLSGLFPETIEPIRSAFEDLLPQNNILVWYAPGPLKEEQPENDRRREVAELIREAFIASLNPDIVHITSLFEGYVDCAVTSIGRFDSKAFVSVTLYDLIPLLNPNQYLEPNPRYKAYYQRKIDWLSKANIMLGISDYACLESKEALKVKDENVLAVSTAIESHFERLNLSSNEAENSLDKFGIKKPFVLYTGGADERKNLPRLIKAYSNLNQVLRNQYQLVFAGRMPEGNVEELKNVASEVGLNGSELVFTGYVSDNELVKLYNLCKLYVFPSWHEGFGLPALEAMACGAPVIGANTTSLPEVIGLEDALFDPLDVKSISKKIQLALTDDNFREKLITNGEAQVKKFSWDNTAKIAIRAWVKITPKQKDLVDCDLNEIRQMSLINQIAQRVETDEVLYLKEIAKHLAYNEGASTQRQLLIDISELCQRDAATGVQRVVRSYLHYLLLDPPKNFIVKPVYATRTQEYRYATQYLSRLMGQASAELADMPMRWQRGDIFFGLDMQHDVQLAHSATFRQLRMDGVTIKFIVHDLLPIQLPDCFEHNGLKELHERLLAMICQQDEAICVSEATANAYDLWIEQSGAQKNQAFRLSVVHSGADLYGSNPSFGMPDDAVSTLKSIQKRTTFLVVSTLEPRKAQNQILEAIEILWNEGYDVNLVLVGHQGWRVENLIDRLNNHPELHKRLFWLKGISDEYLDILYKSSNCLISASLDEGFGLSLIEAARHGLPIIARDIPVFREVANEAAFYFNGHTGSALAESIKEWLQLYTSHSEPDSRNLKWNTWQQATNNLKAALVDNNYQRNQILVDVSELVKRDAKTGIQRVVREVLQQWLENPPAGYRIEPVYADADKSGYWYAKRFTNQFLGILETSIEDSVVDVSQGDIFIGLDLQPVVVPTQQSVLEQWRNDGVLIWFVIYDLLPVLQSHYFPPGAEVAHERWLRTIACFDGVACISKSVTAEFNQWLSEQDDIQRLRPIKTEWFNLGADVSVEMCSSGLDSSSKKLIHRLSKTSTFLMVGTIEPRKGHAQVLAAFEQLWELGDEAALVIVGKQGWLLDELVDKLRNHPEAGRKLFWLEGISDEYLAKIYEVSSCLIAASYGEGYGLPLIEAAQHKLPIIARDIPVFREVAGEYAFYFQGEEAADVAVAIKDWHHLYKHKNYPRSDEMPWVTWQESASQLLCALDIK